MEETSSRLCGGSERLWPAEEPIMISVRQGSVRAEELKDCQHVARVREFLLYLRTTGNP